jgi:hypothetical protein
MLIPIKASPSLPYDSAELRRAPAPTRLCQPLRRPSDGSHAHLLDRTPLSPRPPPRDRAPLLHHCPLDLAPFTRLPCPSPRVPHKRAASRASQARVSLRRHPGRLVDVVLQLIIV